MHEWLLLWCLEELGNDGCALRRWLMLGQRSCSAAVARARALQAPCWGPCSGASPPSRLWTLSFALSAGTALCMPGAHIGVCSCSEALSGNRRLDGDLMCKCRDPTPLLLACRIQRLPAASPSTGRMPREPGRVFQKPAALINLLSASITAPEAHAGHFATCASSLPQVQIPCTEPCGCHAGTDP